MQQPIKIFKVAIRDLKHYRRFGYKITICDLKRLEVKVCDIKLAFSTKKHHCTDLIHIFAIFDGKTMNVFLLPVGSRILRPPIFK